jgi:hypothetical protein
LKKEIPAESIIYGVKRIKNGQYKKDYKREGKRGPSKLHNPLCYPLIEPDKKGPQ